MGPLPPPPPKKRRSKSPPAAPPAPAPPLPRAEDLARALAPFGAVAPEPPPPPPDRAPLSALEAEGLRDMVQELARRRMEALKLFAPTPEQARFFASRAPERLAIGGNRGGKTTAVMVEVARAACGCDPFGKYPAADGIFILVARDLATCARVFYRKLFMAGAFQVCRDRDSGEWRPFVPDRDEPGRAKKAPPLIPPRLVTSVSWENKKERIPKTIRLRNGWELWFFSSGGELPQGVDVDGVAFDEEIEWEGWYAEMAARLVDRRGRFLWSATPQAGTVQLYKLFSKAQEEQEARAAMVERGEPPPPPSIEVFAFGLLENPYLAAEAKADLVRKFRDDEEEYQVRVEGRFALFGLRVYPEFSVRGAHGLDPFAVPFDWTRYCAIDPGRQVCAVLFAAVPPPGHPLAGRAVVYDELYLRRCDAALFARRFRERVADQVIQAAVIDMRSGRITEIGSGLTHEEQYRRALVAEGVRFGGGDGTVRFAWSTADGADDRKAGIEAVRGKLHLDEGGLPGFLFVRGKLPKLEKELETYCYRKTPAGIVTDEVVKVNDHLADCLRYLAMHALVYVRPRARPRGAGGMAEVVRQKRRRAGSKEGADGAIALY